MGKMVKNRNPTEYKKITKEEKRNYIDKILLTARLIVALYPQAGKIRFTAKESEEK